MPAMGLQVLPGLNLSNPVTVAQGGTGQTTAAASLAALGGLVMQTATAAAGFALQNATPNILTWTAPNDGNQHTVILAGFMNVSSNETGGQISANFTDPGGNSRSPVVVGANKTTGGQSFAFYNFTIQANTTFTLQQSSALSVGAATVWAALWAV